MANKDISWLLIEHMLERGDPAFVDELRRFHDADRLARFAATWYADSRPASRKMLLEYLNRPLNAFRHEPLVKRLFKLAEKAGDDEVLARFLVLFDRSVRRVRHKGYLRRRARADTIDQARALCRQWLQEGAESAQELDNGGRYRVTAAWYPKRQRIENTAIDSKLEADALLAKWKVEGATYAHVFDQGGHFTVFGVWNEECISPSRNSAMPGGERKRELKTPASASSPVAVDRRNLGLVALLDGNTDSLPARLRQRIGRLRLFSVHTRQYLRRRTWRYFRRLGRTHPERYLKAITAALKLYVDDDMADGLALIDNWGLIHILFHHSPALIAKSSGWRLAPEKTLADLQPAPIFENLWRQAPRTLLELLKEGRCRPVRQWTLRLLLRDAAHILSKLSLMELFELLAHQDEDVAALAAEALRNAPSVESIPVERWIGLLEAPNPIALEIICDLAVNLVRPERVSLEQAVKLAMSRPVPVARLGLRWLQGKTPQSEGDCLVLLGLVEAQSEPVRPEIVRWARGLLSRSPHFQPAWVLDYLDSRHKDVRCEGWAWLQEEPRVRDDVEIWQKLLESPYDDVRLLLVANLEKRVARHETKSPENLALNSELLRFLWASVLLNIHRGGRIKPKVVRQLVLQAQKQPQDAGQLLPILSVAVRSLRGPEWRSGLAGIVQIVERQPNLQPIVSSLFPELRLFT